jgi:hypothetical protein
LRFTCIGDRIHAQRADRHRAGARQPFFEAAAALLLVHQEAHRAKVQAIGGHHPVEIEHLVEHLQHEAVAPSTMTASASSSGTQSREAARVWAASWALGVGEANRASFP